MEKTGVWVLLTWKDGSTDRFYFPEDRLAEQYRRREHLTPTGRLKAPLTKLEIIPAKICDDAGYILVRGWAAIDRAVEADRVS